MQPSKVETIGNENLLATTARDIRLWSSIDYILNIKYTVNNVKMTTVMCGIVKVNNKVTKWYQQGLMPSLLII